MPYRGANYSFTIDSSFRPFEMQELLTPYMMYKDTYEKQEQAYNELSDKSDMFRYLSDTLPKESKARQIYEGYANELSKQAEDLSRNGLSMNNRRALMNLKRRYQGEIGRLEAADALRKAQIEEQHKLSLQDPTRMFSREASFTSLDDYLDNPALSYQSYSGALLAQQVGTAVSALAKNLKDYGNGKPLDSHTKTWLQSTGYTPAEIMQAFVHPYGSGRSVLNTIVNQVVGSTGMPEWADDSTLRQAMAYAYQGLWSALGNTRVATYTVPKESVGTQGKEPASPTLPAGFPTIPNSSTPPSAPSAPSPVSKKAEMTPKSESAYDRNRRLKGDRKSYGGNLFAMGGDENYTFTAEELAAMQNNPPQQSKQYQLSAGLEKALNGMSDEQYVQFLDGLIGSKDYSAEQADSALVDYDLRLAKARNDYYENLTRQYYGANGNPSPEYNPRLVLTSMEMSQQANDADMWKKYKKYFYKTPNGYYALNEKGRQLYKSTQMTSYNGPYSRPPLFNPIGRDKDEPIIYSPSTNFHNWIDSKGLSEMAKGHFGPNQSAIVQRISALANGELPDAIAAKEYWRNLDNSVAPDIYGILNTLATDGKLPRYSRVKEGNSYVFKKDGDPIKLSDLKDSDIASANVVFGLHGNYLEVGTQKGDKIYIPYSKVFPAADKAMRENMVVVDKLMKRKADGQLVGLNRDGLLEPLDVSITKALNAAYNNGVYPLVPTQFKNSEVTRNLQLAQ